MILAADASRHSEYRAVATMSGCILLEYDCCQPADYLLVDLCSKTEHVSDSLSETVEYVSRHRSTALVWTDMDGLEDAYAAFPHGRCHFLVDAGAVDAIPILADAFGRGSMDRLYDRDREIDFGSLHRISDELAAFARTLARMADPDLKSSLSDKPVSFRPAPTPGLQPFPAAASADKRGIDAASLRDIIKKRRLRERFFPNELFADPAWDILLDLKAAELEGRKVSVSSLCIAASVPPTTALRWITAMTESAMLVRRQDPADARRIFIELSNETRAKLDDYFAAAAVRSGLPI